MPGSYAPGFHEGSRSEYLALYAFSAFGTAAPVLHQEDHGVDLHCTLVEREGSQLAWPIAYFSVQVKSQGQEFTCGSAKEVRWLVRYPAPLLLCLVDKKKLLLSVYQTTGRFIIGALDGLPETMTLVPGDEGAGRTVGWDTAERIQLGPPILQFNVAEVDIEVKDLKAREKFEQFDQVLSFWVLNDQENIRRLQTGLRTVKMPGQFKTNEVPAEANAAFSVNREMPEKRAKAEETLAELLEHLGRQMLDGDDRDGALLAGLMLRQLNPDRLSASALISGLSRSPWLRAWTGKEPADGVYASLDQLLKKLGSKSGA